MWLRRDIFLNDKTAESRAAAGIKKPPKSDSVDRSLDRPTNDFEQVIEARIVLLRPQHSFQSLWEEAIPIGPQ